MPCAKFMRESVLCNFIKIWSFYSKFRNFNCLVTLEMIISVRAVEILLKCKNILQTANKHLLKLNVNLTVKVSKATLKYIERGKNGTMKNVRKKYANVIVKQTP